MRGVFGLFGPCKVGGPARVVRGVKGRGECSKEEKGENKVVVEVSHQRKLEKWGGDLSPEPGGRVSILILSSSGVKAVGAGAGAGPRVPPAPVVGGGCDGPAPPATPPTGEGTALWGGMAKAVFHRRPHIHLAPRLTIHLTVRKRSHLVLSHSVLPF